MRVKLKNGDEYDVANTAVHDQYGQKAYIVKDWNWNWKRDELTYIPISAISEIIEDSGSDFRDGYELGLLHGASKKEEALIKEGIIEEDPDYDYYDEEDEPTNLDPRFDLYEIGD